MLVQNIQCPSSGKPKSYLSQLLQYLYANGVVGPEYARSLTGQNTKTNIWF